MQCPVCGSPEHNDIHLQSGDFKEDIIQCPTCGTVWSINHGLAEVVSQPEGGSFLSLQSDGIEGDDLVIA